MRKLKVLTIFFLFLTKNVFSQSNEFNIFNELFFIVGLPTENINGAVFNGDTGRKHIGKYLYRGIPMDVDIIMKTEKEEIQPGLFVNIVMYANVNLSPMNLDPYRMLHVIEREFELKKYSEERFSQHEHRAIYETNAKYIILDWYTAQYYETMRLTIYLKSYKW